MTDIFTFQVVISMATNMERADSISVTVHIKSMANAFQNISRRVVANLQLTEDFNVFLALRVFLP